MTRLALDDHATVAPGGNKNASRKRSAPLHDHHHDHHIHGRVNNQHHDHRFTTEGGGSKHHHTNTGHEDEHEDEDEDEDENHGIDFQTGHEDANDNVHEEYDQHQHQHHLDDDEMDRSHQSESNDHHCLEAEQQEPNEADIDEIACSPTHETQNADADQLAHPSQDDIDNDNDNDPEWDLIAQHGPASQDVPLFLAARERRHEAEQRFERSLDAAHSNLKELMDGLVDVAANAVSERRMRLDSLEAGIQQEFMENENARADMSKKLEDFAASAQAQFQQLMNRLANANGRVDGNGNGNE